MEVTGKIALVLPARSSCHFDSSPPWWLSLDLCSIHPAICYCRVISYIWHLRKPQTMVFSVTIQDAWTPGDSGQEAALLEPFLAPAAAQIGLEAASAPVGKVPAKGNRSTAAPRAPMPIPACGNPPGDAGNRGQQEGAFMELLEMQMKWWWFPLCLQEQQCVRAYSWSDTSRCPKQHVGLLFLLPLTEPVAPETWLSLPWTPLPWTPKVIDTSAARSNPGSWGPWRGLTLGSTALGQLSTLVDELKPCVITLLLLPLLLRELVQNSISAVCTPIKTIQNTVRWGRNTMNFHHIGISGTIYIATMSLMRRSNKYPLQSSYCNGWERKQRHKGCHILETQPGKKDPQLTRWVRESLGLSKDLWLS